MKQYFTVCIDEQQLPEQLTTLTVWVAQQTMLPIQLLYRTSSSPVLTQLNDDLTNVDGHTEAMEPLLRADEQLAQGQLDHEHAMLQPFIQQLTDAQLAPVLSHTHHSSWKQTLSEYQDSTELFIIESHHTHQEKLPDYLENVMTYMQNDLLIAKRQHNAPSCCIVAFDGRSHNLAFIRKILAMPLLKSIPLHLVIVNADQEERHYFQDAEAYWVANGREVTSVELHGNVAEELNHYQLSNPDSLLVIGSSPHSRFLQFWLGSHTKDIIHCAEGSVCILANC
ncbi:MAG: universal stress protein [Vibrio sp.]